ncbi:glycosyltransferase family 2 protein [Candidatus Woesearchaeota archaeon]|nr:glycosyltransferase family 2 protein [Candidatus Woesearchaeota archaeon]
MQFTLVIPFYNEEKNVEKVLMDNIKSLDTLDIKYEIIAVDNGSTDNTASLIDKFVKDKRIKKITIKNNIGYGYGVAEGLKKANGEIIGWRDGDAQVSAGIIAKLYKCAVSNPNSVCKMKRILREDGIQRKFFSFIFNSLVKLLFGISSKDINAKPKLFPRKLMEHITLESKDWFIDTELLIKAKKLGMDIKEIPGEYLKRKKGKSNVRIISIFEFLVNIIRYYFRS